MLRFAHKKITLPNGLRLLLIPQPGVAATALILAAAGSEYETKRTNGLSHFLEHMVFKGTERRPEPGMTAEALDSLGAEYNAFTTQEFTGYWAKAEAHQLPKLLELVSDLYLHPLFAAKEIEKERGVIIEELNMYEDLPVRKIHDVFMETMYGNQPAGWDVGGTKDIIRKLNREDFLKYRAERYIPAGTVIAISGEFDSAAVAKFIRREFGALPKRPFIPKKPARTARRRKINVRHKESDQSHLMLGVPTFSLSDPRRYPAEVLAHLLGGGMSSRLFMKIREEMGAAYYVRAESSLFLDHGFLSLGAGVNHPKLHSVIKAMLAECARLTKEPVGAAELKKTKDHLVGTFMLELETSDELAEFFAEQEIMTGKMLLPGQITKELQAVSADDLRRLARDIFKDGNLALALIGPAKEADLKDLLAFPA